MDAERYQQVKAVLDAALELEPSQRSAFLEKKCTDDPELRVAVEALLAAHDKAQSFLGLSGATAGMIVTEKGPDGTPERIGPYKILEQLGEGGMGVVYLAEQVEPIRRRVALKLIKLGMDSEQVIARFEAERQALALMDHPNVAKVFDAGATDEGRPYFVMEYVKGIPITEYCDQNRLSNRDRLTLFLQVCEAIQHAHEKGIIHRDIKPSNVLVALQDEKPVPKVIDFGVAKATSQRLTERTLFTQLGILVGTPEYMSPEQAGTTTLDVDTRTDVYSLGVLLYELLVGALPFEPRRLREAAALEMQRIIREEDPPKPSARLNSLGDSASDAATHRRVSIPSLEKQLRGELDWITMKALEKDRLRRYDSPRDLATDIERHFRHEPIDARQPGVWYRAKKFSRRNRSKMLGWGAAILIVFGLTTAAVWVRSTQRVENYAKLTRMLDDVIQHGLPLDELDSGWGEEWLELEPLLQEAIENNPSGPMALKAHRAAAGIRADYPAVGLVSDVPWPEVHFGSAAGLFLPSGRKYLSIARLDLSWDGGPWFEVGRYALSHYGPAEEPEPLDEILNPSLITPGHHLVALRARLRLYLEDALTGSVEEEDRLRDIRARQKIDRADLGFAPTHEETRHLGRFAVNLFEEWPDDYPVGIAAEASDLDGFRIDRVTLVRVSLAPSELSSFTYDWPEARVNEVRLPSPARSGLDGVLVGFELQGIIEPARLPAPLAADISLAIPGDQTIDLAALIIRLLNPGDSPAGAPPEMIQDLFGEMNNFYSVVVKGAQITTIQAGLFAPMWRELRSCEASGRFEGVLQVTPSRSVAAESPLTSYLTNEFSFPVEVEIIDAPARWISEGRY